MGCQINSNQSGAGTCSPWTKWWDRRDAFSQKQMVQLTGKGEEQGLLEVASVAILGTGHHSNGWRRRYLEGKYRNTDVFPASMSRDRLFWWIYLALWVGFSSSKSATEVARLRDVLESRGSICSFKHYCLCSSGGFCFDSVKFNGKGLGNFISNPSRFSRLYRGAGPLLNFYKEVHAAWSSFS